MVFADEAMLFTQPILLLPNFLFSPICKVYKKQAKQKRRPDGAPRNASAEAKV